MMLAVAARPGRERAPAAARPGASRSSPTRRPAACSARTGWSTTSRDLFDGRHRGDQRGRRVLASRPCGDDLRLYLVETAEKGIAWLRLAAHGRAGHGSMINDDNAVTALARGGGPDRRARVADRLTADGPRVPGRGRRGHSASSSTRQDPEARWPSSAPWPGSSARRCATPPTRRCSRPATSTTSSRQRPRRIVDCRFLPGLRGRVLRDDRRAARRRTCDARVRHQDIALETDVRRRPGRRDGRGPAGRGPAAPGRVPYCLSGGTDNKALQPAGHPRLRLRAAAAAAGPRLRGACSTASTSGCRWTPCSSAPGCWTGSCAPAERALEALTRCGAPG